MTQVSWVKEGVAFSYMLGEAMYAWALFEHNLWHLVKAGSEPHWTANINAFDRLDGASAKISFADQLVRSHPVFPAFGEKWAYIHKTACRLALKRNEIAHHLIAVWPSADQGHRHRLINQRKGFEDGRTRQGRGVVYVMTARSRFIELTADTIEFTETAFRGNPPFKDIGKHLPQSISLKAAIAEIDDRWNAD
jgi:hypothetical protein